ncbi:DUF3137 domain-containing protein [Anabaena azotica]|uniref:DUF3137 domain-containing protein n=1 Tax=Anabaena azotica FACHB-119 TaxID=947527 RepID=A0ABR8DA84_9NOST|nr:DUF3137 domain-containing protein [Anabaena azotica]MBD2504092.1 DUF3137 domain-containing protein [Anabaena azotica FACHB-119]
MEEKYTYAVESLYTHHSFNPRLIEVEAARKEKIKTQLIFGGLIWAARIFIGVLALGIFMSIIAFFVDSGISHILSSIVAGGVIYGLIYAINWAKTRINFFVNKHTTLLFYLRKDAIEKFVKIIFPNAEQIIFDPQVSSKSQIQGALSNLFYNKLKKYTDKNILSFTMNKRRFQMADVEPIYVMSSRKEPIELDTFVDRYNGEFVCYFKGIVYQMEYEKENLNTDFLTLIIPKNAAPSPTKPIKEERHIIQVSKDYPQLKLVSRDKRRPDRFIKRGYEEYSVENMDMEDNFYVFTNNENESRKLLSYRFMELIVKATLPKCNDNETAKSKVVEFLLGNQHNKPNFWMEFNNITRRNNKPLQKLTVVCRNRDLTFFDLTGEKSCTLDNFQQNFQELETILHSIITTLNLEQTNYN